MSTTECKLMPRILLWGSTSFRACFLWNGWVQVNNIGEILWLCTLLKENGWNKTCTHRFSFLCLPTDSVLRRFQLEYPNHPMVSGEYLHNGHHAKANYDNHECPNELTIQLKFMYIWKEFQQDFCSKPPGEVLPPSLNTINNTHYRTWASMENR